MLWSVQRSLSDTSTLKEDTFTLTLQSILEGVNVSTETNLVLGNLADSPRTHHRTTSHSLPSPRRQQRLAPLQLDLEPRHPRS